MLAVRPVLHRQAEDPRHRRPCRPLREALRQGPGHGGGCQEEVTTSPAPACPRVSTRALRMSGRDNMFDRLGDLASEHAELERALADPGVHADADQARTLAKRYAELTPIVHAYREWQQVGDDEQAARELGGEDASFAKEADELAVQRQALEERLRKLLVPNDPNDKRDTILEVKAGEGGDESALFAGDLLRMYQRYAERRGWKTEIIDSTVTGLGGVKDATVAVKAGRSGTGAWSRLKYEGGVHRVQRVPVTESQGRIHTSAAGVLVTPEADPVEVQVNDNDL